MTTIGTSSKESLQSVIDKIERYSQDCTDDYTKSSEVRFNEGGLMLFPARSSAYTTKLATAPNDHAWSQLIERLDAPPASWLMNNDRCPVILRSRIMNRLVTDHRSNQDWFVRMKGETTRAVLSNKYSKFDNKDLIKIVEKIVTDNNLHVDLYRPTVGDFFSTYVLLPEITFDNGTQGGLHPGAYISNGEVGNSAYHGAGGLWRFTCSNGAIIGWNRDQDNTIKVVHKYLTTYDMQRIVSASLLAAFQVSEQAAKAYMAATEIHVDDNAIKSLVNTWANTYGLSTSFREDWLKAITGETIDNGRKDNAVVVDVFNAATRTARVIENAETRENVERMAGDYLMRSTRNATQVRSNTQVQTIQRPRYDFSSWRVSNG